MLPPTTYFKIFQKKSLYTQRQIQSIEKFLIEFDKTHKNEFLSVVVYFGTHYNDALYHLFKQRNSLFVCNVRNTKCDFVIEDLVSEPSRTSYFYIDKCHSNIRDVMNWPKYINLWPLKDFCTKTQLCFWEDMTITHCVKKSYVIGHINEGPHYNNKQRDKNNIAESYNNLKCLTCSLSGDCTKCPIMCNECLI